MINILNLIQKKIIAPNRSLDGVQIIIFYIFIASLPFYQKISSSVLILLLIIGIYKAYYSNKKVQINVSFSLPILLFFSYVIPYFYHGFDGFILIENRLFLLVTPLALLNLNYSKIPPERVLRVFVYGTTISIVLCYINAIFYSFSIIDSQIVFDARVSSEFSFLESSVMDGNRLFGDIFSIFHQSTYLGYYVNLSAATILAFALWKKSRLFWVVIIMFAIVLFQLSSKLNIVIFILMIGIYGLLKIKSKYSKLALIVFVGLSSVLFFTINPRGKQLVEQFTTNQFSINPSEKYGYSLRLMSWISSIELLKKNPIKGYGLNNVQTVLNNQYKKNGYTRPLEKKYNVHNQFLQVYLENGLPSIVVLLLLFVYLFKHAGFSNDINIYILYFGIIMFVAFLFESVLNRYAGISIFTFMYCYLLNSHHLYKKSSTNHK